MADVGFCAEHRRVRRIVVLVALLAAVVPATAAATPLPLRSLDAQILTKINAVRTSHGLVPVRPNRALARAAAFHSRELARGGYFAHESPGGGAFWRRVAGFYGSQGYSDWRVGENLLWSSPDVSAKLAIDLWMASPHHRENVLDPRWREVGLSSVREAAARGVYEGLPVTIVTCDFGVRR
jgi:uncharacterized protein YkwD